MRTGILGVIACAALIVTAPREARTQLVSGYVDVTASHSRAVTDDPGEGQTRTIADTLMERFNITYGAMLYPYVRLRLGFLGERLFAESESEGEESEVTITRLNPSVDLAVSNPRFSAGVGARRIDQRQRPDGLALVRDAYDAHFGLRREEGRPALSIVYARQYMYDEDRVSQDTVADRSSLSTRYNPVPELDLGYQIFYSRTEDRLNDSETTGAGNSARASYTTDWLDRRVSLNTNFNTAFSKSEMSFARPGGAVTFPVNPGQGISGDGLFGSINPPEMPEFETMVYKPLLIDGEEPAAPTATDINIGHTPLNQDFRSIGLVFPRAEEMNVLYLSVNQDISEIAGSFTWDVYISPDRTPVESGPKQWTLWQRAAPAVFNAFDRRFEIVFNTVETQFIKVVTRPLSGPEPHPPIDISGILVTGLQAIRRVEASTAQHRVNRSFSYSYDLALRTKLTDSPALVYYDFYYSIADSKDGQSRYMLTNAVTAMRRFSPLLSGTARAGRDDSNERLGHRTAYTASVGLAATPLRTLSHSLVVSGQHETLGSERTTSRSAFLANVAELYRGVTVNVSGGANASSRSADTETRSSLFNAGAAIIPHRTTSITVNHSRTATRQFGPEIGEVSSRQTTNGAGVSYSPFPALHFSGSVTATSGRGAPRSILQNYAASWSPFSGGALQVSLGYVEQIQLPSNLKTTSVGPSIRWRVNPRMFVNVSYTRLNVDALETTSRSDNYDLNIRWLF